MCQNNSTKAEACASTRALLLLLQFVVISRTKIMERKKRGARIGSVVQRPQDMWPAEKKVIAEIIFIIIK
jgi:hypothetical protein